MWVSWLLLAWPALGHGNDRDEDSWIDPVDCAPFNPIIFPGAVEDCSDYVDNDCDDLVDLDDEDCAGEAEGCGSDGSEAFVLLPLLFVWSRRRGC